MQSNLTGPTERIRLVARNYVPMYLGISLRHMTTRHEHEKECLATIPSPIEGACVEIFCCLADNPHRTARYHCSVHTIRVVSIKMRESTPVGSVSSPNNHVNGTRINGTNIRTFEGQAGNNVGLTNGTSALAETQSYEPIAIVGCAMRLPGNVNSGEALWNLLDSRLDGRCRVPYDRYNVDAFYGPGKQGHVATEFG